MAGRKQHPGPLLSWLRVSSGRSRIQAQGPMFAQAAKPKQSWSSPSPGREAHELPALERAGAAHAGVGRGAGQQTGTRGALQASGKGCLVGVSGRKGVQEKTSQGGSLCPQPLSVTTSSVEQIYIKTILEHKKGHKTRLLYREGLAPGGTGPLERDCTGAAGGTVLGLGWSPWGAVIQSVSPSRELECLQLVPSACRLHVRGEVKCVAFQLGEGDGRMLQVVEKDLDLSHHIVGPDVRGQGEVCLALPL